MVKQVSYDQYISQLAKAKCRNPSITKYVSTYSELEIKETLECVKWYIGFTTPSGFGVTDLGELVGLFSATKGRGTRLINSAKRLGATNLNCYDGFLVNLYGSLGFIEVGRERNYDPSGPDVVWMELNETN